ncbi:MAG TPA: SRPBCC family protein [Gaiellaceae bacterium]|nr:SRPBCC family protein [Gaiellaceae bacterium]
MPACRRVRLSGAVPVALPPEQAFELFTPEGERAWSHGWDPRYPAGDAPEAGTVFLTNETIWTVLRCEPPRELEYSRVTPGERAGRVSVRCEPDGNGGTVATVGYDLTALDPAANDAVDAFAAGYEAFLEHWRHAIAAHLG